MSDTSKHRIQNGRPRPPQPSHLRDGGPGGNGASRGTTDAGMFAKPTPAMPDDPRWGRERERSASAAPPTPTPTTPFTTSSSTGTARTRAEGSQVAPLKP